KATICTNQTNALSFQSFIKGLLHKSLATTIISSVSRPKPSVGYHSGLTDKGHKRMMRITPPLVGVVTFCATLLITKSGDYSTVKINCEIIYFQLIKKPLL